MGTTRLRARPRHRRHRPARVLRRRGPTRRHLDPAFLTALHVVFLARRKDLLALDTRKKVYDHVHVYPGVHLREIARGTGLDPNHVKYHLTHLEKGGLVTSRREDGYWRFWPTEADRLGTRETIAPAERKVLALLRRPVPLHIVTILLDREEANQRELVEHVGASQSTVSYHLKRMQKDGLVEVRHDGRERFYRLREHDRIHALLMRYKPPDALVKGFLDAWEQLEL